MSRTRLRSGKKSRTNAEIALACARAENHHQLHWQELHDRLGGFCKNIIGTDVPYVFLLGLMEVLKDCNPQFLQFQKVRMQFVVFYVVRL